MRVTAPVLFRANEPMRLLELDLDDPGPGEVRVKMSASGVCHSCLHTYDGTHDGAPMPIVLGDEGSGIVEAVGSGVENLIPGDHVVISWAPGCGLCRYCGAGYPGLCVRTAAAGYMADGTTRFHLDDGSDVYHYGPATYGSSIVVDAMAAVPIRKDFPLDLAALIGCSVTTGFGAVVNTADVRAGQSVAVIGCGGVGLNAIQGALVAGAYPIIGIDVLGSKLEYARYFGATHTIDATQVDVPEAIRALTGDGVDAAIVAVGSNLAMEQGLEICRKRGICVLVGVPASGTTVSINPRLLVAGERRLVGSRYGSGNPHLEFPKMIELAMAGKLKVEELVTKRYGLDEADEAFRALAAGEQARGLIVF